MPENLNNIVITELRLLNEFFKYNCANPSVLGAPTPLH